MGCALEGDEFTLQLPAGIDLVNQFPVDLSQLLLQQYYFLSALTAAAAEGAVSARIVSHSVIS
jgi:hypothetical protein